MLTKEDYAKYKSWIETFPDKQVKIETLPHGSSWDKMFKQLFADAKLEKINAKLSEDMNKSDRMYPSPDLLFNAFSLTPLTNLKVVIIGQDPYFTNEDNVPQAMGLSFSVPVGFKIPSSLQNIFASIIKYKHSNLEHTHGNLEFWARQGCLLLNTSLTVLHGEKNKNCHQATWKWFTDKIIKYISDNTENVVFVLWGGNALEKLSLIDIDKHDAVISSHPSGLSANTPLKSHPAFSSFDQFGKINRILEKWDKSQMIW